MLKKRLFVLGMSTMTIASLLATTAVSANPVNSDATATYTAGTAGPVEPVDPSNPEGDQNNWMVEYPKTILLTDNHKVADKDADTVAVTGTGYHLNFKVKQKLAGPDLSDKVTAQNVGSGIKISVNSGEQGIWAANEKEIKMKLLDQSGNVTGAALENVKMAIGNNTGDLVSRASEDLFADILTLTHDTDSNKGYAVLTDNSGAKDRDGNKYTAKLTFKFERQN